MPTNFGWRAVRRRAAALLLTSMLAACGGGGGGGDKGATASATPDDGMATLSGVLSVVETAAVDSDTNDENQAGRQPNNGLSSAQALTTPFNLVGTVNVPQAGPDGPNKVNGDAIDAYVVDLQADQVVELEFATDDQQTDLDLAVFNDKQESVAVSQEAGNSKCVRISKTGRYYVGVLALAGASVYNLRAAAPGASRACATATTASASTVADQLIAMPHDAPVAASADQNRLAPQGMSFPAAEQLQREAGVTQLSVPSGTPTLLTLPATSRDRLKGLAQIARYSSFRRASTLSQAAAQSSASSDNMTRMWETLSYARSLMSTGQYAYVALNHTVTTSQVQQQVGTFPPDDPYYSRQRWHYEQINLPAAMDRLVHLPAQPARRPLVAVIDSGIVSDHPDLAPQIEGGRTFVSLTRQGDQDSANPDDPDRPSETGDPNFHGSHVAGTIAARTFDGYGAAGVAPMAQIMPLRVFDPNRPGASEFDIIHAMLYAAGLPNRSQLLPGRRADVINLSLGGPNTCQPSYMDTIQRVRQAGVIIVAAAGNGARNNNGVPVPVATPANCPGVVAVGALDAQRRQADYSQSGPELQVSAPGGDMSRSTTGNPAGDMVFSTVAMFSPQGVRQPAYVYMDGTSMASPHVAGVVALMKYVYPELSPGKFDEWLKAGKLTDDVATGGYDTSTGYGLINARKAVDAALAEARSPGPAPLGQIVAAPSALDFGAQRTSMSLGLGATAATADVITRITPSSSALSFTKGNVDAKTGLGTYTVNVDRSKLPSGTSYLSLTVQTSRGTFTVQVTVVKQDGASTGRGDYGPIYVMAIDANTETLIAEAKAFAKDGRYEWHIRAPKGSRLYLIAGGDLDQNQFICDAGEPCGGYPLLSDSLTLIELNADMRDLDFAVSPMSTGGALQASVVNVKGSTLGTRLFTQGLRRAHP